MPACSGHATVTAQEWDESVLSLLDVGRGADALLTLERALNEAREPARVEALRRLLESFPAELRETDAGTRLHLRLLGNLPGAPQSVLTEALRLRAAGREAPFLSVFLAWALAEQEEDEASLQHSALALRSLGELSVFEQGLLWRTRGRALARTGQDGWREAFERALERTAGRTRAMTRLEHAALLARDGDAAGAMRALSEAQQLARRSPLEISVVGHMGLLCLQAGELEDAERHFRRMTELSGTAQARHTRSRALCSLAAARRALGEWKRAEHLYEEALKAAIACADEDDQRQALRGLGHTRRLSGRRLSALEPLEQAARTLRADRESGQSWVYVDIAAVHVSLPHLDPGAVEEALARAGRCGQEDTERAKVVRAELARRTGDATGASEQLRALQPGSLWMREEAHAFPELFRLLPEGARPAPLPRPQITVVRLRAIGFPQVTVNAREVTLPALSVLTLAALLEAGGQASSDALSDALHDDQPRSRRQAEQRVSKAVSALRRGLGWPGSVVTGPGHYRLDPEAEWQCDVTEALAQGQPVPAFLSGIHLRWATDREQRLSLRD